MPDETEETQEAEQIAEKTLGERLRELREAKSWSLSKAGKELGLSRMSIWKIEKGGNIPRVPTLQKFARGYGVSIDELLSLVETEDDETRKRYREVLPEFLRRFRFRSELLHTDNPKEMRRVIEMCEELTKEKGG